MGVVVRRWRRWQRGLRAVPLPDMHGCGQGRLDELMSSRALTEESLHPPSPALVHNDHLDDLLALDECFWAELSGLDGAEEGGWCGQGQRCGLNAGLAQLIGLQPPLCCCFRFCHKDPAGLRESLCVCPLALHWCVCHAGFLVAAPIPTGCVSVPSR